MAKISNGFFCYGWRVEDPCLATYHNYVATCPAQPGVFHKEATRAAMRTWCERHDFTAQACAMIDRGESLGVRPTESIVAWLARTMTPTSK